MMNGFTFKEHGKDSTSLEFSYRAEQGSKGARICATYMGLTGERENALSATGHWRVCLQWVTMDHSTHKRNAPPRQKYKNVSNANNKKGACFSFAFRSIRERSDIRHQASEACLAAGKAVRAYQA